MTTKSRRHDIDWIRVIVFDLLILYHVGMFFVPWGWHIKNNVIIDWLQLPMAFLNQWRLPILFLVSGMGTRFALSFRSGNAYIRERFIRLGLPLMVGMLLIIPPQVYLERLADGDFNGSYWSFYPHFFEGIYPTGNFSWHHLWFLPYLLLMSLLLTPVFLQWRTPGNALIARTGALVRKNAFNLYLLIIPLLFVEAFLEPIFPITHALVGDWYALAFYLLFFAYGYVLICLKDTLWTAVQKVKIPAAVLVVVCFPSLVWFWINYDAHFMIPMLKIINLWSAILAILGFCSTYLNKETALIKYRNEAVYPLYILHQTITVVIGFYLMNSQMHYVWKMILMVVGTFGLSMLIYELLIRRWFFLRPLFGLKNR